MSNRAILTVFLAALFAFQGPLCALACESGVAAGAEQLAQEMPCHGGDEGDQEGDAAGDCGCEPSAEVIHSKVHSKIHNKAGTPGQYDGVALPPLFPIVRSLARPALARVCKFDRALQIPPSDILLRKSTLLI